MLKSLLKKKKKTLNREYSIWNPTLKKKLILYTP